jgi:hypothetical protein
MSTEDGSRDGGGEEEEEEGLFVMLIHTSHTSSGSSIPFTCSGLIQVNNLRVSKKGNGH